MGNLSNLGLGIGLVRFVPDEKKEACQLVNATFTMTGIIAILVSLIYLAVIGILSPVLDFILGEFLLVVLFILFTVSTALSLVTDQALLARRSTYLVFWKNFIICLIKLPLPVMVLAHLEGYGIFAATGIAIIIGIMLSWIFFLPMVYKDYYPRPALAANSVKKMSAYSFYNYLAGLLNSGPGLIYPFLVINYYGPEQSAYFYIAWMMAMVLSVIPTGMAQSLFAEGSRKPDKLQHLVRKSLSLGIILSIVGLVGMIMIGGWFLRLFGAEYYDNGSKLLWILSASVLPQCINTSFISLNQVNKRVYLIVAQAGVLAAIALGLGYWMLISTGLRGLAEAYFLAHLIVALLVSGPLWVTIKQ